ncbi:sensor histidine kinase [Kribbella ginsengisoli]|uniref:histidine kinase n=1 Tax=Kribbella ginsengisoli TaxID=363865 RepID=A0ABP6YRJ2_9ACTN
MRQVVPWLVRVCVGFARACVLVGVTMVVPAVWAIAAVVWIWWGGNPWSLFAPVVLAAIGTFALARPVCRMIRYFVARWTGTVIPGGYLEPAPVTQMSTGYWWNGRSYSSTQKEAKEDQELANLWRDPATWRDLRFLEIAPFAIGLPAAIPPAGIALAVLAFIEPSGLTILLGALGLIAAIAVSPYAWRTTGPVAIRFLRPSQEQLLAERVDELTAQRADSTVAQAAEIRRIERDLHDGAQARLVALGLALATAEKLMETNPEQAKALMREARAGAATSLTELRELVQGINPPVLNERGLIDAVRALALDSPLAVTVSADTRLTLDPPIESALYFAVAELLTNTTKHAHATSVRITFTRSPVPDEDRKGAALVVEVSDDGKGGATARKGGGLEGLQRRLAVFDGGCEIASPPGGPTTVRMVVPCESL